MHRAAWLLILAVLLAGCTSPGGTTVVVTEAPAPTSAHVVLGIVDDGINPYHEAFRDDSPEAFRHPATYLPGYPATARPLHLDLNSSFDEAMKNDAKEWEDAEPGVLYWIPGTRIVAYWRADPFVSLDAEGYGTAAAGRAAGNGTSLAPTAKIAFAATSSENQEKAVTWATNQSWIDVLLVGWNAPRTGANPDPGNPIGSALTAPLTAFAMTRPLVVAAGNGIAIPGAGAPGVAGAPAFLDGVAGVPGAIVAGGHDNGRVTPWTGTMPHVVADARRVPVPSAEDDLALADEALPCASGTTVSAAWVAGAAAAILLDARSALRDFDVGGDDALARGNATAAGPLADGNLTLAELRAILLSTADPSVATEESDGGAGDTTDRPGRPTLPIGWAQAPPGAWRYAFHGYGAVTSASLAAALAVLRGDAELPDRADADAWAARDAQVREALSSF